MKILVPVDGSAHTLKALDYLQANRAMFVDGHELVVVHVSTGIPGHVARHVSKEVVDGYYAEECAKVIEPIKTALTERGISNFTTQQRHGHAAEEVLKAASEVGAGLIVMCTHGHGIFGRALLGSVATKVLAETTVPLLLVK
jgi:nucleotide-binding universal stress UspA family protein